MTNLTRNMAMVLSLILLCPVFLTSCRPATAESLPPITPWQLPKDSTEGIPLAAAEPDPDGVQLLETGLAEQGGMVIVRFNGPAKLMQTWGQGSIYIVDEETGTGYKQVGVAPVLGPLFAKPGAGGGPGYVLLMNPDQGIKPGSTVTVVLGKYKRVHIKVQ
jgi:hypothetical protein